MFSRLVSFRLYICVLLTVTVLVNFYLLSWCSVNSSDRTYIRSVAMMLQLALSLVLLHVTRVSSFAPCPNNTVSSCSYKLSAIYHTCQVCLYFATCPVGNASILATTNALAFEGIDHRCIAENIFFLRLDSEWLCQRESRDDSTLSQVCWEVPQTITSFIAGPYLRTNGISHWFIPNRVGYILVFSNWNHAFQMWEYVSGTRSWWWRIKAMPFSRLTHRLPETVSSSVRTWNIPIFRISLYNW